MGMYFCSSVLMMRMNMPAEYRMIITEVLGGLHFNFYHRWFDVLFLVSAVTTILVLYIVNRPPIQDPDQYQYQQTQFKPYDWSDAKKEMNKPRLLWYWQRAKVVLIFLWSTLLGIDLDWVPRYWSDSYHNIIGMDLPLVDSILFTKVTCIVNTDAVILWWWPIFHLLCAENSSCFGLLNRKIKISEDWMKQH